MSFLGFHGIFQAYLMEILRMQFLTFLKNTIEKVLRFPGIFHAFSVGNPWITILNICRILFVEYLLWTLSDHRGFGGEHGFLRACLGIHRIPEERKQCNYGINLFTDVGRKMSFLGFHGIFQAYLMDILRKEFLVLSLF